MNKNSRILVAGHRGMVGSALVRLLEKEGYSHIRGVNEKYDLRNQKQVKNLFDWALPEYVFLVAARVGGIMANSTRRAEFIYDNLMIQSNIIHAAYKFGVKKLLFTGSSCIYPKDCPQPIKEEYLLTAPLEETNKPYAVAKIAGIEMCQAYRAQYGCNFICAMPTNSYGPNDHYDPERSHVLPALLRKIITAKEQNLPSVAIWGTGRPRREFLYVDDMAEALIFLMNNYESPEIINVGHGQDISIAELAKIIAGIVGYTGEFTFTGQLDGMMEKRLDVSKINALGWQAGTSLPDGIRKTIEDIKEKKYW